MKKLWLYVLTLVLLAGLCINAQAAEVIDEGSNETISWTLTDDGTLTVSGEGVLAKGFGMLFYDYYTDIRTVIIEEGITKIPGNVFLSCKNISSVTLPDTLTEIGSKAFYQCTALESISLPEGLTGLYASAFMYTGLKEIYIPGACLTVSRDDLSDEELTLQGLFGYTSIFAGCDNLTKVEIGPGAKRITPSMFSGCSKLETLILPEGLEWICDNAFAHCDSLTAIDLPDSVEYIDNYAFAYSDNLKRVCFPEGLQSIGFSAFSANSGLESLRIPSSDTTIVDSAFKGCFNLKHVVYGGTREQWDALPENTGIPRTTHLLLQSTAEELCTFGLCCYCTDCDLWFDAGLNPVYHEIAQYTSNSDATCQADGTKTGLCSLCDQNITVQDEGSRIPIGQCTCSPASVAYSGTCGDNLTWTLDCAGTLTISGSGEMDTDLVFDDVWNGKEYEDGITVSPPWYDYRKSITQLILEEGVTTVGDYAFTECTALTSVTLPKGVTTIGTRAFRECSALEEIILSPGLAEIKGEAFEGCQISSLYLPDGVTSIQSRAFVNQFIAVLRLPASLAYMGNHAITGVGHIFYCGTQEQWDAITFDNENNTPLTSPHFMWMSDAEPYCDTVCTRCPSCLIYFDSDMNPVEHTYGLWTVDTGIRDGVFVERRRTCSKCGDIHKNWKSMNELDPFTDVDARDYFYQPVLWAVANEVTNGTSATTFSPADTCTRGQVVTFLWRAFGQPEPTLQTNPFTDIQESDYFYKAVLWAVERGITNGMTATTFAPSAPCTRGHVVTFLHRTMGLPTGSASNPFADVLPGEYYCNAVVWAVEQGVTNGLSETTFGPNDPCTRGQIVTFLQRALG